MRLRNITAQRFLFQPMKKGIGKRYNRPYHEKSLPRTGTPVNCFSKRRRATVSLTPAAGGVIFGRKEDTVKILKAPKVTSGDSIDLKPYLGKAVAVMIRKRSMVETKFGERPMNEAVLLVEGESKPLFGVLFQSYFSHLSLGEWYVGKVEKQDLKWSLNADDVDSKTARSFEKLISGIQIEEGDVPF